ncbi:MAG: glycosyl transferase [Clostridiaceae bacterium]|nr:glycosyl transferase [Clostridiaceae bacterium]
MKSLNTEDGIVKFIAFYLPQYHCIPENDMWWGKNFTEWERVKNTKPLYPGHNQPRVPFSYYDLSDVNVMKDQANLARKYGIHGFCFYHYWFNGKLLLEKPLQNMLYNKGVNIPFCLAWANEPWTRAWDGNNKIILMDQIYGNEISWLNHIRYLTSFFKDQRYIKINGKPLFLIYRTESFKYFDQMIKIWDEYLKAESLNGIFIAEMLTSYQKQPTCLLSEAVVEFEPMFTLNTIFTRKDRIKQIFLKRFPRFIKNRYRIKDYDKIWKEILSRNENYHGKKKFLGAFTDWDNSPRFGSNGLILVNGTVNKFENYLLNQAQKSKNDLLFINAWNEWAEGAYLEPDRNNGYSFLEAVKSVHNNIKNNLKKL